MNDWTQVVTNPLGLGGFALFLVFSVLGARNRKPAWLPVAAYGLAGVALIGGLLLAYRQTSTAAPRGPMQNVNNIEQSAAANGPNIAGVQGNVSVNVEPSSSPDGPLTLADVEALLSSGRPERDVLNTVQKRGVGFSVSPPVVRALTAKGATDREVVALAGVAER